ncbi:MAG: hypothetical protein ISN28_12720 [Ectothiorhodospiraceae bacterium AqS1]|nr:hypothetical protein [Ectothiorhodospiraceae bacterium AqS1]
MNSDIIKAIEEAIDCRYHLERDARSWLLSESEKTFEFRVPDNNSIAFSLDNEEEKPFSFFSKSPPRHWAKICDAFLVCAHENIVYLFKCEKQLINSKLFCDWLLALCREHDYPDAEFSIASVLVWEPRESKVTRKITSGRNNLGSDNIEDHGIVEKPMTQHFSSRFDVRNRRQIVVRDLISRMNRRPRRQRISLADNT